MSQESQVHKFLYAAATEKYFSLVFCEYCGYIAFYGNDMPDRRDKRQAELPTSCIPKPDKEI